MAERAKNTRIELKTYNPEQQKFLNFILNQYVTSGEKELEIDKLKDLLILKYNSLSDAKNKLGNIKEIRHTFINFQPHIYTKNVG